MKKISFLTLLLLSFTSFAQIKLPIKLPIKCFSKTHPGGFGSEILIRNTNFDGATITIYDSPNEHDAFNTLGNYDVRLSSNEWNNPILYLIWKSGASVPGNGYKLPRTYEVKGFYFNNQIELGEVSYIDNGKSKIVNYERYVCRPLN